MVLCMFFLLSALSWKNPPQKTLIKLAYAVVLSVGYVASGWA